MHFNVFGWHGQVLLFVRARTGHGQEYQPMPPQNCKHRRHRGGFMFIDAIIGLALVGIMVAILGITLTKRQRALREMAEQRTVQRAAEAALDQVHAGKPLPPSIGEVTIKMTDAAGGQAPAGYHWVQVQASSGKRNAVIVGLIAGGTK